MSRSRALVWFVWIIASIFYAYQYVLRVMPSIMMADIMQKFNIDAVIYGQFSGIYYIGYAFMHLPLGIMLDRYGPKKVITICILLTVLGLLPLVFSNYWIWPLIGRGLIGIGSSAAILGVFKIIRMSFSADRFSRMLSLSVTIGLIGAIYGGGPLSKLYDIFGYTFVIQFFACAGLLLGAITYFIVPAMEKVHSTTVLSDLKTVLVNKKVLQLCIYSGLLVGPLEGFADVWGAIFLKKVYGLEPSVATTLPSMIFIGMCFGAPVLSLVAEKTRCYLGSIIGAGILMMVVFVALIFNALFTISGISIAFLLVGVACSYQILSIYKASTYVSNEVVGLTTAVANMIIMSFGYAFHSIIGYVINTYGGPQVQKALIYGVSVIPVGLAIGVLGLLSLAYQKDKKGLANSSSP